MRLERPRFWIFVAAMTGVACIPITPSERAMSLVRQHKEEDAVKLLRADLALHPDDLLARKLLIRVLAIQGDLGAAKDEVDVLSKQVPDGDPAPWIELGHAYELTHKFDEALAAYDEAAEHAPSSSVGPREGGMRAARWGEVDEAAPRLEEAVKRGAHDAETMHALGLVRLHLHDLDGAEHAYRDGLREDPKSTENVLGLATVAVMREDANAALKAYDRLIQLSPNYGPAELGRAWALAKLGRKSEAAKALDHAEELGAPRINIEKQRALLQAKP